MVKKSGVYLNHKFSGGITMSRRGENIFKRKDGRWEGRYISCYNESSKAKYKSVYAHSYAECSQKLKLAKSNLLPDSNPLTFSELFYLWLESRKISVRQSTYVNYRTTFDNHIKLYFGSKRVDKVTSFMINGYISDLLKNGRNDGNGLSPQSVQAVLILLKSVFTYGEIEYKLNNPAKNISLPKAEYKEIQTFTSNEMQTIRANGICNDCFKLGVVLCLYTGLRIGEICALKWSDINILTQTIHVRKTLQRIKNSSGDNPKTVVIIDEPKSDKSIRDVPIPTFMLLKLAEIKNTTNANTYFLTCKERYTEPRTYQSRYKTFLKSIGVEYKNFHVLRHTFATECIRLGIDVKTVSELLGHASVKITLERYVHSDMEMKRKQLEKLFECE
jgi:integrase